MTKLHLGAVGLLDALGWKGRWRKQEPEKLIRRLEALEADALVVLTHRQSLKEKGIWPAQSEAAVLFLSDTILVASWATVDPAPGTFELRKALCLHDVSTQISRILSQGANASDPLAYRGHVVAGEFLVEGNFMVGPAIDEAAEWMNASDGAFVTLSEEGSGLWDMSINQIYPDARENPNKRHGADPPIGIFANSVARNISVPMKAGTVATRHCVNPMAWFQLAKEREEARDSLLRSFDVDREDVKRKRDNTAPFLDRCLRDLLVIEDVTQ